MATLLTVATAAISAVGAIQQGKQEEAQAVRQAETIRLQGEQDAIDKRKELMGTVANINAAAAASGIALTGQGSIEQARTQAKAEANRQLNIVRHNAAMGVADKRIAGAQARTAGRAKAFGLMADAATRVAERGEQAMSGGMG